ncbi:MAG: pyridoxal-phosphate dependent enzyme, partial [Proteobacteria bacterium]|nr:pyridoxal-phosphate dependent enzyme [Pseudomonadota bacterium]
MTVTASDIRAAAGTLHGHVVNTPFLHSRTLSEVCGGEVWLKFENHQFTASFKERGALNKLASLTDEQARHGVLAVSAGNHAQAVAYHAQRLGMAAVIVMPKHTPLVKVSRTRHFQAEIVLAGESFDEALAHGLQLMQQRRLTLVHPYDDPQVIAGQGTMALEMLAARPDLDALVIAIGGGGLIALAQTFVGDMVPPKERGRYQVYIASVFMSASLLGPVLGGLISEALHWSVIFWINLPLGLAAYWMTSSALKRLPRHERPHKLDVLGAVLITSATMTLLLALSWGGTRYPWTSLPIGGLVGLSLLLWL